MVAQELDLCGNPLTRQEFLLLGHRLLGFLITVIDQRHGSKDIVVGKVGVLSLKMKLLQKQFQLECFQIGTQQTDEPQRVEADGLPLRPVDLRQVAVHIALHDVVVVIGIMSQQRTAVGKVEKHPQSLSMTMELLMLALLDDRIDDVAKHRRYLAIRLDINREGVHHSTLPNAFRGNLHHIILKDIQSRSLRVEDYDILLLISLNKTLQHRLVAGEQLCRRDSPLLELVHQPSG